METHDGFAKIGPTETNRRSANIRAAGETLRDWILTQRGLADHNAAKDVEPADPGPRMAALDAPPANVENIDRQPDLHTPAWRWLDKGKALGARALVFAMRAIRRHAPSAARWSLRIALWTAAAAVIVAALAGGERAASRYWARWRAIPMTGTAVLDSSPSGSEVLTDGTALGTTPVTVDLPPGRHAIEFRRGKLTRTLDVDVAAGHASVARLDWNAKPTGQVRVQSDPAGARVTIDGRFYGVTPLIVDDIAVGSHSVVLQSDNGLVRRTVSIPRTGRAEINEAIHSGWLHVSSPFELEISDGSRALTLDDQNIVLLPSGPHDIRVRNRALGFSAVRHVDVQPEQMTAVTIDAPLSSLTVTASEPAEVDVDGVRAGDTPLIDYAVSVGVRDIEVRAVDGKVKRVTSTVTVSPVRVNVDFSAP